jgi:nucleoside-diphosphate-sugar epimerase
MTGYEVGVIGATSFVGACVLSRLKQNGHRIAAFSRQPPTNTDDGVNWQQLPSTSSRQRISPSGAVEHWICVAPIWVLPEHFAMLEAQGVRRIVALSSTSRLTKNDSSDPGEQGVARRLKEAEEKVQAWTEERGIEWVVLRPTLIYGLGRDKNIGDIARFIRRFRFFPLLGKANGQRQPIHAQDVADACVAAMQTPGVRNRAYNISGAETLSYREMVTRVFEAMDRRPLMLRVPLMAFRSAVALMRHLPGYGHLSAAMAERMNRDLVFDHSEATRDFAFEPRKFRLSAQDLPE